VPHVYFPVWQRPVGAFAVVLRSRSSPAVLAESLRKTVQAVDPQLAIFGVRTMEEMLDGSLAQHRFSAQESQWIPRAHTENEARKQLR